MKKYLALTTFAVLLMVVFFSCGTPSDEARLKAGGVTSAPASIKDIPLSLVSLPTVGRLNLEPVNSAELERLGLGRPVHLIDPPYTPYNDNGLYWSEPFSLIGGDIVQITVDSDTPVSWFGVDWSNYDVRGILATLELDEDGRAFDPQYPAKSSSENGSDGYRLTVSYKIRSDTNCVLVVKNANPENSQRLSMAVSLKPSISLRRIGKSIPILKNLIASDSD
jgi:hypothetical protein